MKALRTIKNLFNACSANGRQRRAVLAPLRGEIARSPSTQAALAWMHEQNIKVVFDEACIERKVMGRYSRHGDTRWIALSPQFHACEPADRIDTLVHEIRHAWQDSHDMMLPYNLKFNMKHGMLQAFLWLCAEEADAHAHGMVAAAEAFGAAIEQPLGYQAAYIDWFTGRLAGYLDGFIAEWDGLIAGVEKKVDGNAADMKVFLADCRMATQEPVDQASLCALGQTITGINYQTDAGFSAFVQDVLIDKALTGPVAAKQAELAVLDARISAFGALAANQNTKPAPQRRRSRS